MRLSMRHVMLFVAISAVQSMQYNHQRKFLLLHGTGTTSGAFLQSPTKFGAKGFLSGVPCRLDAGNAPGVPINWQYAAIDAGSASGYWWEDADMKGAEASIKQIEDYLVAQQGQIAGVVGHEQGATLAALVAARAALAEGPLTLQFAVLAGGAMPTAQPYIDLLDRLRSSPDRCMPTLHCLSRTDAMHPSGEELAACFASAEVLWHDRGGAMPDSSWWKETRAFPDRATGITRYCDQWNVEPVRGRMTTPGA